MANLILGGRAQLPALREVHLPTAMLTEPIRVAMAEMYEGRDADGTDRYDHGVEQPPQRVRDRWYAGLMKNLLGVTLVLALSAGCTPNNKEQLEEASVFEKRACACKDAACTDGVVADVKIWFDKYKDRRGTQSDVSEIERKFTAMGECMAKAGMSDKSTEILLKIAAEAEKL